MNHLTNQGLHHFSHLPDHLEVNTDPIFSNYPFRIQHTESAYEFACSITGWQQLYHQITPGQFTGILQEIWLDGIQIYWEQSSNALSQSCMAWPKSCWFGLSPCETLEVHTEILSPQNMAICAGGIEFELVIPNHFSMIGMVIHEEVLSNTLMTGLQYDVLNDYSQQCGSLLVNTEQKQKLRYLLLQAINVAQASPQYFHQYPVLFKSLRHDILDSLMTTLLSSTTINDTLKEKNAKLRYSHLIKQAKDYILAHQYEALSIIDLTHYLKVSRRTLQNCFLNTLGITPLQYLKAIRLNAVRRELESELSSYSTVQDIAMSWGFWHLSQFAADYKAFFGIKPSESIQRRGCITKQWNAQCAVNTLNF